MRFVSPAQFLKYSEIALSKSNRPRMRDPQCLFVDCERPSQERIRLEKTASLRIEHAQIVQARCGVWMVRPQRPLADLQRPPVERLSFLVLPLALVEFR